MPSQVTLISLIVQDTEGAQTRLPLHYKEGEVNTRALAQGLVNDIAPLYADIAKCTIVGAEVTFPLTAPADASGAQDFYTNNRGATLSFKSTANVGSSLFVPGFDLDKISSGNVDLAAPNVNDFINALTSGGGITNGYKLTDLSGNYLTTYVRGKLTTRK